MDLTTEDRMDYVSSMGFALGYIGSTIPFILCMAIVILAQFSVIPISVATASQITFVITAIWWAVFTLPLLLATQFVAFPCSIIFGKLAAIIGPFLVGIVTQITGKSNFGILSVIILFIIGGIVLLNVPNDLEKVVTNVV